MEFFSDISLSDLFFGFAFLFPLLMAWLWMAGGIWFYFKREFRQTVFPESEIRSATPLRKSRTAVKSPAGR